MKILFIIAIIVTIIGILTAVAKMVVSFYDWVVDRKKFKEWEKKLP